MCTRGLAVPAFHSRSGTACICIYTEDDFYFSSGSWLDVSFFSDRLWSIIIGAARAVVHKVVLDMRGECSVHSMRSGFLR